MVPAILQPSDASANRIVAPPIRRGNSAESPVDDMPSDVRAEVSFGIFEKQTETAAEQLAEQSQAGCRSAFEKLVELHESRIFSFLLRLTRNRHDAEDLTQETFVKAYRNIHRYQPAYAFASWLFTIARRTAFSHFRSARPTEEIADDARADSEDPGTLMERKDESASLWKLARTLKPKQYEALWLRYGEGFSVAEVAQVMKTNQIHVKVLLHRARTALAVVLRRSSREN